MATAKSSPLRWQMSPSAGKKDGMNSAACGRLRHLQAVATWASAQVPPLGAFLGSYLASTSQALGTPPPSSPHFTCQRCESVLQVGINCSVRVRSRKRKKWSSVSKEVSPSVNCIFYCCQYCAFENMKLGTSKAYVKTKLSEMAARHKLSELNKGFEEKLTKGLGEKMKKTSNQELESATNVLSIEIAGTSGKKAKRKGWLSLKQLAASSAGSPSTGNRPVLMRSAISDLTPPRMNNLDSFKLLPKFSQVDFKDATSVSSIEEKCSSGVSSLEFNLKLEQSDISAGDIGIENALDVVNLLQDQKVTTMESSLFTTNMSCLNASPHQQQRGLLDFSGELALNSGHYVECVHSIYDIPAVSGQPSNVTNSPQKLGQSVVAMEVEKKEQLSSNRSEACAIVRDQLTAVPFYPKHDKLTFASQGNSVDEGSQIFLDTLSPSSSTEGS
ncbi:hypothetical protein L7F22_025417 [Adiantum nelumboides]|nr:hypothetical protein [Adiantum nelumboides]